MCRGLNVCKTSRRDLALVMAKGLDGATTVSATMLLAARAGIHVFVTGGEFVCHNIICHSQPREHVEIHDSAGYCTYKGTSQSMFVSTKTRRLT